MANSYVGLQLEALNCIAATPDGEYIAKPPESSVPPAVVCTALAPLQLELDQWFPPSQIGIGEAWPLEAIVQGGYSFRMPIGLLWDRARRQEEWHLNSDVDLDPCLAVASAARQILRTTAKIGCAGLVVPNWLRQAQQQSILNALSGSGFKWQLVWRAIAAATYWIDQFLARRAIRHVSRTRIGKIICLHLGLFECECSCIELVAEPVGSETIVLPARQRTKRASKGDALPLDRPGIFSEQLAAYADRSSSHDESVAAAWRTMWATPWLQRQVGSWRGLEPTTKKIDCPSVYDPPAVELEEFEVSRSAACDGITWPFMKLDDAKKWIQRIVANERNEGIGLDGAVVTGELASILIGNKKLGEALIEKYIPKNSLLIAGESAPDNLLAVGAAEQCRRIEARQPSYLTKLPWLRTVISRAGEPEWKSLLAEDDPYVMGGQRWARPEPVTGINIPGSHILKLAIDHEDFDTVRETVIPIPELYEANQPSEIHVTITPAQGNARVEIRPIGAKHGNRSPQLIANLLHMEEVCDDKQNPLPPEEYLKWVPRICPPILGRLGSLTRWEIVVRKMESLLQSNPRNWSVIQLRGVRDELRTKVGAMYPRNCTAVGSDGAVELKAETFKQFGNACMSLLSSSEGFRDVALRCLAYMSFDSADLRAFIRKELIRSRYLSDAELRVVGNCMRDPKDIAVFISHIANQMYISGDLIRTMAELTSYRPDALEYASTHELESIYLDVAKEFQKLSCNHRLQLHFRYVTLCCAFMLRRRVFDDSFLPTDERTAQLVKSSCQQIISKVKTGRVYIMGGAVDMPKLMKQLVDYVDRKGHGAFVLASG